MFKEIENLNKELANSNLKLEFNLYLNKKEREFLNLIMKYYAKIEENKIKIPISEVLKNIKIPQNELFNFLEKLSKKSFSYFISISNRDINGIFFYISSFFLSNNNLTVYLPYELTERKKKKTLLSVLNFKCIYYFLNKYTYPFYSYFFSNFILKKSFEIEYEELKNILGISSSYERFFDFEKNVLHPIAEDLEEYYRLEYSKIKSGDNINNKIIGIKFSFKNNVWDEDETLKLKSILFMVKKDIVDPAEVYSTLKKCILDYGYEQTFKMCFKVKSNYKNTNLNFDECLNFYSKQMAYNNLVPVICIKKYFNSPSDLRQELLENIRKKQAGIDVNTLTFSPKFLQELFTLSENKTLNFENDNISIIIDWKKDDESIIKVYFDNFS